MIEWDLLDEKDDRVYLAYMTNRQDPFVMFERDFGQMMDRAFKEIYEGYTHLWAMKRVGVILPNKICYFPDNELLIEPSVYAGAPKKEVYIIFLFSKNSPSSPFMYAKGLKSGFYSSFESAAETGARLLNLMANTYPEREFKVLCTKLLYDFLWYR
ncbi:hypothetical protein [Planococcus chinensis]|uniref:Uncharacterized protein n=1 Tax=Planococcus chinensis TaxID=272917 RepID=A0ABW4QGK8_9BACL